VTLTAIAEDSGARVITKAELLANAADVDTDLSALNVTGVAIVAGGKGGLVDNGNGTWTYTPALNDDTNVSFSYTVTDGGQDGSRFGFARHHPGQRRADDLAGDPDGDCRGQRRSCDHEGRASRQCR
jgi:hypothetical protein